MIAMTTFEGWTLAAAIVGTLTAIVAAVIAWLVYRRKRERVKVEPDPLRVQQVHDFVRNNECLARHQESLNGLSDVRKDIKELREKNMKDVELAGFSRKAIYKEIKDTNEGTRSHIESVRVELSAQINNMPDRIIALLRNAGVIK